MQDNYVISKCSLVPYEGGSLKEEYNIVLGNPVIDYFESIKSPSISMTVTFIDVDQVISRKGITGGEYIDVEVIFESAGAPKPFKIMSKKHKLILNAVRNVVTTPNKQVATLEFVSVESIINETARVSKKYTKNVSNTVFELLVGDEKGIQTSKNLDKHESTNSYSFIGNLKRPFDTIQWLCPKSQSSTKNFGFLFYENLDGYHFKSIEKLLEQDPVATYSASETPTTNFSFKIIENNLNRSNDIGMNCRMGMYANKTIFVDIENNTQQVVDFDISELKLKKPPKLPTGLEKQPTRRMFRILDQGALQKGSTKEDVEKRNELAIYQNRSYARNNLLFSQSLNISVPINIDLKAGDIIKIEFPLKSDEDPSKATKMGSDKTNDISGRYLISELRHMIGNGKSSTQLQLIRDVFTA